MTARRQPAQNRPELSLAGDQPGPSTQPDPYNGTAVAGAVADLAAAIRYQRGSGGVMLAVDELQAADLRDLRALGGVLNALNNWHEAAPVVFCATGLPNTMAVMRGGRRRDDSEPPPISNPSRLFRFHALDQFLPRPVAEQALRKPALAVGGDWDRDAVTAVYETTRGYPAHLQTLALHAWARASGPVVTGADVQAATPAAHDHVFTMYMEPMWEEATDLQRAYLTAISLCGGEARSGEVAAMLGRRTSSDVTRIREPLVVRGDVVDDTRGTVLLAQPMLIDFAPTLYQETYRRDETGMLPSLQQMAAARDEYVDGRSFPRDPELDADQIAALSRRPDPRRDPPPSAGPPDSLPGPRG